MRAMTEGLDVHSTLSAHRALGPLSTISAGERVRPPK